MDTGLVAVKVPTDLASLERLSSLAIDVDARLSEAALGNVDSLSAIDYEPFTEQMSEFGKTWNEMRLNLREAVEIEVLIGILSSCGIPDGTHLTYTDRNFMCGHTI